LARTGTHVAPRVHFPSHPRDRIAVASYPFRDFIAEVGGKENSGKSSTKPRMDLQDFAAHVVEKFNINKIELWTGHFPSTDPKYLEQFRSKVEKAGAHVIDIAVDGEHSPYSADRAEREKAIAFSKQWVDVAAALGSPSIRTNIPAARDSQPDVDRTAESLLRVIKHAAARNVVVSLENDNPLSEDPLFLVQVLEKVNNPWLHALPDFGNTVAARDADYAYRAIDALFAHAYCICHVKESEQNHQGEIVHVDLKKTFDILKKNHYKGYCSIEWDTPGDPYKGTADLIEKTAQYLS
jgi:sugar phosphate isomerase/epimerase